jgi:hypothetical protein
LFGRTINDPPNPVYAFILDNLIALPVALTRILEPFVFNQLWNMLPCKSCKSKKKKFSDESLHSFLNSAMNIEFVYVILVGIRQFRDQMFQVQNESVESSSHAIASQYTNSINNANQASIVISKETDKFRVLMKTYTISNVKKWDVSNDEENAKKKDSSITEGDYEKFNILTTHNI